MVRANRRRGCATSPTWSWQCTVAAVVLGLAPGVTNAAATKMARLAKAAQRYATQTGMPARRVPLAHRGFDRLFVAVTPQTLPNFLQEVGSKSVIWADPNPGDRVHVPMIFGGDKQGRYATNEFGPAGPFPAGTRLIPIATTAKQLGYMSGQVTRYGADQAAFLQDFPERAIAKPGHQNQGHLGGGCMWLWMHMHADEKLPMPHLAGINRCANPPELVNRLVHAGNELVGPIGVMIAPAQVELFRDKQGAFADAALLGELPQSGAEAVIRK